MEKEIEIAKSWFVFAQILIILSGFLFASGGITYGLSNQAIFNNIQTKQDYARDLLNQEYLLRSFNSTDEQKKEFKDSLINVTDQLGNIYIELTEINLSAYKFYTFFGVIFAVLSLFFWGIGATKLRKIKENNR